MRSSLADALAQEQSGELQGLIQIIATEDGEQITVTGAFAERVQYGIAAMIKALDIMADKVIKDGSAGDTYLPSIDESMRRAGTIPAATTSASTFSKDG
jgi:hypothetical protein